MKIHGVLSSAEQLESEEGRGYHYRCTLVPRLWRRSLEQQSQVHQELTIPQVIEAEFKSAGFTDDTDYLFNVSTEVKDARKIDPAGEYPEWEYYIQHRESDLAFMQRSMERDGISFYFEHNQENESDKKEKIIVCDAATHFTAVEGGPVDVPFNTTGQGGQTATPSENDDTWHSQEAITSLTTRMTPIAGEYRNCDYNWHTPSKSLLGEYELEANAVFGQMYEYGTHHKTSEEGAVYAEIRSQEAHCRQMQIVGKSNCKHFQVGSTFNMTGHFNEELNTEYLLIEIRDKGSQPVQVTTGAKGEYEMTFVAIPTKVAKAGSNDRTETIVFRPRRITPKPMVPGIVNAKIDDSSSGDYAELDDNGSYKCRSFSDLSETAEGKGSRFVRQAQDYAGAGMGSHFPAHKGTEVIFIFTEGDPNRPIICGQIPNAETLGPVSAGNQTQCKTVTGGGTSTTIEDTDGSQSTTTFCPVGNTTFRMGKA